MRQTAQAGSLDYREYPVLFVDDEQENARAFELAFRRDFSVVRANSASEALEVLSKQRVAVVLSDHRMPGMTGTQLLSRIREIAPQVVRLLVTAYGDAATLAQAINDGAIYRYVAKPWNIDEMRNVVRQAIELFALEGDRAGLLDERATLNGLSLGISKQRGLGPVVEFLVRKIVADFGFDGAQLFLAESAGALEAIASFSRGRKSDEERRTRRISQKRSGEVLRSLEGGSTVLLDLDQGWECGLELRELLTDIAAEELLLVPLRGWRGMLGALAIDNRCGGRRFSQRDRQLLESIAAVAALAVEHAVLTSEGVEAAATCDDAVSHARETALALVLSREVRGPLEAALKAEPTQSAIREAENALGKCIDILEGGGAGECELDRTIESARMLTASLAREMNVVVRADSRPGVKVRAPSGPLLQIIVHLLELAIFRASDSGTVGVGCVTEGRHVELRVSASPSTEGSRGCETGGSEELLRAACVVIASELKGGLELGEGVSTNWCLRLDSAE